MHPGNTISSPTARTGRALGHAVLGGNVLALPELIVAASLLSPHFLELRNLMNVLRGASVLFIVAPTLIATRGLVYVVSDGAKRRCDRPPRTHAPGCD